ncbi:MAG: hypothetical protein KJZ93_16400 [Caldilineaceae bacterium]|nr:hypothetical protein [Caldilineaceae bacterium]
MNQTYEDRRGPQGFNGCLFAMIFWGLAIPVLFFVLGLLAGAAFAAGL